MKGRTRCGACMRGIRPLLRGGRVPRERGARWIPVTGPQEMSRTERELFSGEVYRCSACGKHGYFGRYSEPDRYCSSCGARMGGKGKEA